MDMVCSVPSAGLLASSATCTLQENNTLVAPGVSIPLG